MLRNAGRSPLLLPLRIIRDEVVLIASRLIGRRNAGLETGVDGRSRMCERSSGCHPGKSNTDGRGWR
jgi:hypothetical protein